MAVPEYLVATADLGGLVKRAAVRSGGKSILAKASCASVEDIEKITSGRAQEVGRGTLIMVVRTSSKYIGGLTHMLSLVDKVCPDRTSGHENLSDVRIQHPLTNAERRPQMV